MKCNNLFFSAILDDWEVPVCCWNTIGYSVCDLKRTEKLDHAEESAFGSSSQKIDSFPGWHFTKGWSNIHKKCTQSGNNVFNVILQKAGSTCTDIKTLPMHSMLSMHSMQSLSVFTILQQINTQLYSLIDGPSISFALQSFQIYPRLDTGQSKHCNAMIIAHFKF